MDWKSLRDEHTKDNDLPDRAHTIGCLTAMLDGTIYDVLPYAFHVEKNDAGEYIQLRDRRPSVPYGLCSSVVDDSVGLLFSEEHFPTVTCENNEAAEALEAIAKDCHLNETMIDAGTRGSVGSVAIRMRVLSNRYFFDALNTQFLTPVWKAGAPDTLEKVIELYKTKGKALKALGYPIAPDDAAKDFWFRREWDSLAESWFDPLPVSKDNDPEAMSIDSKRSVTHSLGFVPMVWIRNLPGGDDIDGKCTFSKAISANIEIDYLLSQGGRGLKYAMDPTLLIKEPATGAGGSIVKGGGNAIVVGADGDAKMLEMSGDGTLALLEYVRLVRQIALESIHGNKADADKIAAAQSGRAMELMNQALIWLADKLRISYGEKGLLQLYRMIAKVSQKAKLVDSNGQSIAPISLDKPLTLKWPAWYAPTWADKTNEATTLTALTSGGILSKETATDSIAEEYDIEDVPAELTRISGEKEAADAAEVAKATAIKPVPDNEGT
jgi:hypothetical protein